MSNLRADIKYALRTICKHPGYSLVVALTMALGLGINATVFGMMDAILLRPFPLPEYERLVILWEKVRGGSERDTVSAANFLEGASSRRLRNNTRLGSGGMPRLRATKKRSVCKARASRRASLNCLAFDR